MSGYKKGTFFVMIVMGAGGHALELLDLLIRDQHEVDLHFYDDTQLASATLFLGKYPRLTTHEDLREYFDSDPAVALGVGSPRVRELLAKVAMECGGTLTNIISSTAEIGKHGVSLGSGLNIMQHALISSRVTIGDGCLINRRVSIHHDTVIGDFCEVAPHAVLTGGVTIGPGCRIGANATILPNVSIAAGVIVGAGAVINKDVTDVGITVVGVPARPIS